MDVITWQNDAGHRRRESIFSLLLSLGWTFGGARAALRVAAAIGAMVVSQGAAADATTGQLTLKVGPAVYHYRSSDEHNNLSWLIGASWQRPSGWEVGGAWFSNSFDQPSQYLYVGRRWFPGALPEQVYVKLTGGVMLGYKKPYHDKIPLNHSRGVAAAVLPALGYQHRRGNVQLIPLGTAGLMVTFGLDL